MRKKIFYVLCFMSIIISGWFFGKSDLIQDWNKTEMKVINNVYDFGNIPQGKEVTTYFKFSNAGSSSLSIGNIESRCGCTITNWETKNLKENESDSLLVSYDAENLGFFSKEILVYYNSVNNAPEKLFIIGTVVE